MVDDISMPLAINHEGSLNLNYSDIGEDPFRVDSDPLHASI